MPVEFARRNLATGDCCGEITRADIRETVVSRGVATPFPAHKLSHYENESCKAGEASGKMLVEWRGGVVMCESHLRFARGGASIFFAILVSGCAIGYPAFTDFWANNVYHYPVGEVVNQVRCELVHYIASQDISPQKGEPNRFIVGDTEVSVKLTLQTDVSGSVNYIGVDLSKLGLASIARFIAVNKDTPSLGVKLQGKGTISSTIDMKVPIQGDKKIAPCDAIYAKPLAYFFLEDWITGFLAKRAADLEDMDIKAFKMTLATKFQLVLGISSGFVPLNGTTFLLPINSLSGDYGPTFTHSLEITFEKICRTRCVEAPDDKTAIAVVRELEKEGFVRKRPPKKY